MRILTLHSDYIEILPKKKALKSAEGAEKEKKRFDECLVVFMSVEKRDESNPEGTAQETAKEIKDVAKQVETKNIVLYPYVHLSSEPSAPHIGKKVLDRVEELLKKGNFVVDHAPFGWYKAFTISVKGHPLSELSREITVVPGIAKKEEEISGALQEEGKVVSEWFIMEPNGKLHDASKFKFSKSTGELKKFYKYEVAKAREDKETPAHVKYMKALELVNNEAGSDPGNLTYYPKGRLVKSLLELWVTQKSNEYGAMEVETPIMYDYEHPALKDYLNRFPARQYIVESIKKRYFLRFAACFGQFLMKAASTISYKDLPLKMYELTRYSFRLEKRGELSGLRRQRAFTMPDMHTVCKDMNAAKHEFSQQFKLGMSCMEDLGIEQYETAVRFTKDFWKGNKKFVESLAKLVDKPILIEMWNKRFAYFDPKFEFNIVDTLDKAGALTTVQIDHENAERYGIDFTDEDNTKKLPKILHCSPSGGIERCMWALIENAVKTQKNPTLPLWLSPTQIRLLPVNDEMIPHCEELVRAFDGVRVDIDDRSESISKKVRDAEKEWIPVTIVIGEKEMKSEKLPVRFRSDGKVKEMEQGELEIYIKKEMIAKPFKPLPLPRRVSKRPIFAH